MEKKKSKVDMVNSCYTERDEESIVLPVINTSILINAFDYSITLSGKFHRHLNNVIQSWN